VFITVTDRTALTRAQAAPRLMGNAVRHYDWGSRTALARIQGRPPQGRTEAELWVGAHPLAPSTVRDLDGRETCLADEVATDPLRTLGAGCVARFGPRLPFLLKILAVDRALSVQVHPDAAQATAGWAAQQTDPALPERFTDPWPKPELLVAVTHVEALAGWRPTGCATALVDLLDGPRVERLHRAVTAGGGLAGLALLAGWPADDRPALAAEVAAAVRVALAGAAVERDPVSLSALMWVSRLLEQHPGDPLVLAPLLLELHLLAPGEALFVPAGVAHAYLSGLGVEIMGASDNVVRAGLSTKAVDVPLLLGLVRADAAPDVATARPVGPAEALWAPPAREFRLSRIRVRPSAAVEPVALPGAAEGPQILLCLTGDVEVCAGGHRVTMRAGESVFLGADAGRVRLVGTGEVYRACVGAPDPG
jgi:mannose-6-phosphate isomerase